MKTARTVLLAIAGYIVTAVAFTWPLARHLSSMLPGPVTGDTGVYVWNLWLFRHEIVVHHRLPYFTTEILSLTRPVDLSLHNYTVFDDLLAFPFISLWGPVVVYNLVYVGARVLSATAMFLLARRHCRSNPAAWLAGLLFAWSPALVARGEAHLSLVTAAALPIFVLAFDRWWRRGGFGDAALAGAVVAWAVMSDPYYGVYCLMLAAAFVGAACLRVSRGEAVLHTSGFNRVVEIAIGVLIVLVAAIAVTGGFEIDAWGIRTKAYTLYTPVLALTTLVVVRSLRWLRPRVTFVPVLSPRRAMRGLLGAALGCALPLVPFIIALRARVLDGGRFHAPTLWRSSPRGVDLLALVAPNPNHILFRGWLRPWIERQPGGFAENVASLTFVAIVVIAIAIWRARFRPSRFWLGATIVFALLSLGPFVHIAGVNTYVPGPWALLRYVPIVASARMPARFAAPMMMALGVLFAAGLAHLAEHYPARRRLVFGLAAAALIAELAPVPHELYDASVPAVYATIARDPRPIRIMELPLGFRDGESSYGNFTAASQFYQTFHHKPLIGGYLSRISKRELVRQFRFPVVRTIVDMSEGREPTDHDRAVFLRVGRRFAARARIGYVVVDRARTPEALRRAVIEAFGLMKVGEDAGHELYRVPDWRELALGSNDTITDVPAPAIAPIDR